DDDVLAELRGELDAFVLECVGRLRTVLLNLVHHARDYDEDLLVVGDGLALAPDPSHRRYGLVDVERDFPLGRLAAGTLRCLRDALLAEKLRRFVDVALRLLERALAVHHPRARALA